MRVETRSRWKALLPRFPAAAELLVRKSLMFLLNSATRSFGRDSRPEGTTDPTPERTFALLRLRAES